jgi:hypothetical protein
VVLALRQVLLGPLVQDLELVGCLVDPDRDHVQAGGVLLAALSLQAVGVLLRTLRMELVTTGDASGQNSSLPRKPPTT